LGRLNNKTLGHLKKKKKIKIQYIIPIIP